MAASFGMSLPTKANSLARSFLALMVARSICAIYEFQEGSCKKELSLPNCAARQPEDFENLP
jgi:hypothetical protein